MRRPSHLRSALGKAFLYTLPLAGWMSAFVALVQPTLAAPMGTPAPISPPGKEAGAPAVAITRQGVIHIVWEQDDGLWYRNQHDGVWSEAVQVAAEGENPTLAADPTDEAVYLAWEQEFGGNYEIFSRKWDSAAGWSLPHNVSSNDGGSSAPTLALSPQGEIHLIWADATPGTSTLYHAISTDGESWPVALPIAKALGGSPTAAFDAAGVLHIAWQYRASFSENLRIWTTSYQNNAWSPPVALTDGSKHAFAPDMTANGPRLALVWQEGDRAKLAFAGDAGWRMDITQDGKAPAVAITRDGIVQWAWGTAGGLARQFGLDGWISPLTWATTGSRDLALTAQGNRIGVVWTENQGGGNRVFYFDEVLDTMYQPMIRK